MPLGISGRLLVSAVMVVLGGGLLGAAAAGPKRPHSGAVRTREGGTFRIAATTYDSVDPARAGFWWAELATCALLVRYPDKPPPAGSRIVPEAAADYPSVSRDGLTYTFRIRKRIRFNTGTRVTAANYAREIDRVLSPDEQSTAAGFIDDIAGARAVEEGKKGHAAGVQARGNVLSIRLTKRLGDFVTRLALPPLCPVPLAYPTKPEGIDVPPPGSGPYYIAMWARDHELVLKRNRFYRGGRPHHVAQFVTTIGDDPDTITREIDRSQVDWGCGFNFGCSGGDVPTQAAGDLGKKYGVNRRRFFARPEDTIFYLALNTQRPLFRNNPALRRAVNFALDRPALVRARGSYSGFPSDGYLPQGVPGASDVHPYPLRRANVVRARALARGHTRGGVAVLYASDSDVQTTQAHIVQRDLKQIGVRVAIEQYPFPVLLEKEGKRGEPFDMTFGGWNGEWLDPIWFINGLLDGRTITKEGNTNLSYFDVPQYNRRMARASRLSGPSRYRAYGRLALDLAKNAAPLAVWGTRNTRLLVSNRVGCIVFNGYANAGGGLDLAAACLK
jgi:ABC-type oligopeptide transport system substrate-binding subunit